MKLYLSSKVLTELTIRVMGNEVTLPLPDAGFYGVLPVFKTKAEALKFGKGLDVIEIITLGKKEEPK